MILTFPFRSNTNIAAADIVFVPTAAQHASPQSARSFKVQLEPPLASVSFHFLQTRDIYQTEAIMDSTVSFS